MPSFRPVFLFALWVTAVWVTVLFPFASHAMPVRWADGVVSYTPGPDDLGDPNSPLPAFGDPNNGLGPPDSSWVTLGEQGTITLSFSLPFGNMSGPDFAVFENPFVVDPQFGGGVFGELAFVEVSSDGFHFVRFPSLFLSPLGDFDIILEPELVTGLAGLRSVAQGGDPFDLADLAGLPEVSSGDVNLAAIAFVRLVDIVGDGNTPDSFGNAILDPYPTASEFANSGFELDAVGVIPEPATLLLAAAGAIGALLLRRARRT